MVGFPLVMRLVLGHYIEHPSLEIPLHMKILFHIALWLGRFRWLLTPAIVVVLFLIAEFTAE